MVGAREVKHTLGATDVYGAHMGGSTQQYGGVGPVVYTDAAGEPLQGPELQEALAAGGAPAAGSDWLCHSCADPGR